MIVNAFCQTCLQPFVLLIQASDVELVKSISTNEGRTCPCPRLCGGEINLTGSVTVREGVKLRDPVELTGLQLFKAVGGLGVPDEIPKDPAVIDALLKTKKVVSVDLEEFSGNFYLNELRLEGGITVHLASGARGARVLKITKESPHGSVNPG